MSGPRRDRRGAAPGDYAEARIKFTQLFAGSAGRSAAAIDAEAVQPPPAPAPPPKKPAFVGLVGRESLADLSVSEVIKIQQIPRTVADAARATEERRQAGLVDDPVVAIPQFQSVAFDPDLRGADPRAHEGGHSSKGRVNTASRGGQVPGSLDEDFVPFAQIVANNDAAGFRIEKIDDHAESSARFRTPWWIIEESTWNEFLRELARDRGVESPDDLTGGELLDAAGLDATILREHYFFWWEDSDIYENHAVEFLHEHRDPKRKWTKSGAAVKKRRQRLVARGNKMFGNKARPVEGPEHQAHLARWASIRRLPDIKTGASEKQ